MRTYQCKPRSREIVFPDRFSFCVIKAIKIVESSDSDLKKLCENLFNDIYIMDQQACTSPQLFNWVGDELTIKKAKHKLSGPPETATAKLFSLILLKEPSIYMTLL